MAKRKGPSGRAPSAEAADTSGVESGIRTSSAAASQQGALDAFFGLSAQGTNIATEFRAGLATFLTMAYIMFVNPAILEKAGMDVGAVFVATCLAAAAGSIIMGLYANYPIALAPGMGLNAYFAFTVVPELGGNWQLALGCVFISGVLFFGLEPWHGFVASPPSLAPTFLKMELAGAFSLGLVVIVLTLLLVTILDTAGTLIGVARQAEMLDGEGGLGFIAYVVLKAFAGRFREINAAVAVIAAAFLLKLIFA